MGSSESEHGQTPCVERLGHDSGGRVTMACALAIAKLESFFQNAVGMNGSQIVVLCWLNILWTAWF